MGEVGGADFAPIGFRDDGMIEEVEDALQAVAGDGVVAEPIIGRLQTGSEALVGGVRPVRFLLVAGLHERVAFGSAEIDHEVFGQLLVAWFADALIQVIVSERPVRGLVFAGDPEHGKTVGDAPGAVAPQSQGFPVADLVMSFRQLLCHADVVHGRAAAVVAGGFQETVIFLNREQSAEGGNQKAFFQFAEIGVEGLVQAVDDRQHGRVAVGAEVFAGRVEVLVSQDVVDVGEDAPGSEQGLVVCFGGELLRSLAQVDHRDREVGCLLLFQPGVDPDLEPVGVIVPVGGLFQAGVDPAGRFGVWAEDDWKVFEAEAAVVAGRNGETARPDFAPVRADFQRLAVHGQTDRAGGMADGMLAAQGAPGEFLRVGRDEEEGLAELVGGGAVQPAAGGHDAEELGRRGAWVNQVVFAADPELVDAGRGVGAEVAVEDVSAGLRPAVLPEAEVFLSVKEADDGGGLVADDGGLELERAAVVHEVERERFGPERTLEGGGAQPGGAR